MSISAYFICVYTRFVQITSLKVFDRKDSENDLVTMQPQGLYIKMWIVTLAAEKVCESILYDCKLKTPKFTYQQTEYAVFTHTGSLFSPPTEAPS